MAGNRRHVYVVAGLGGFLRFLLVEQMVLGEKTKVSQGTAGLGSDWEEAGCHAPIPYVKQTQMITFYLDLGSSAACQV